MAPAPTPLDDLRRQHGEILAYEKRRDERRGARTARELRPHVETWRRHLAQWAAAAQHADNDEASPLVPMFRQWCETLGIPDVLPAAPPRVPAAGAAPTKGKGQRKKDKDTAPAANPKPKEGAGSQTSGSAPAPKEDEGEGTDDPAGKLLGKGNWLESHAKIIREQVPKVKTAASDPAKYLAAKGAFLKRNLIVLQTYSKAPKKAHSPLFAYCVMYLSDLGRTAQALKLAEKAVELQQASPIKRNYHELLFDVRLAELEREAPLAAKAGQGPRFDALNDLRAQLMADPFRGNHAKAKVCKIFAQAAMAAGDYAAAKSSLQEVKFLDPNLGVETLLVQCTEKLGEEKPAG